MKQPHNMHDMMAQMRAASSKLMNQGPGSATEAIQQALSAAGLMPAPAATPSPASSTAQPQMRDINPPPAGAAGKPAVDEAPAQAATPAQTAQAFAQDFMSRLGKQPFEMPSFDMPNFQAPGFGSATPAAALPEGAQFIDGQFSNHAGTRSYKLYIPSSYHGQAMPLL